MGIYQIKLPLRSSPVNLIMTCMVSTTFILALKGSMSREARERKAQEIVNAGIGFTSRGCVRKCGFCVVPRKEGRLHQDAPIKDLINPGPNVIISAGYIT